MTGQVQLSRPVRTLLTIGYALTIVLIAVSLYVRMTQEPDPRWTELTMPVTLVMLGVNALVQPNFEFAMIKSRTAAGILFGLAAILLVATLIDFTGA